MKCAQNLIYKSLYSTLIAGSIIVALEATGITSIIGTAEAAPQRCKSGYVWREATRNDHVCVRPSSRRIAAQDNARASSRIKPGGGSYGPFTCKSGYVWREATGPSDKVCVKPSRRSKTNKENRNHARNVRPAASAPTTSPAVIPTTRPSPTSVGRAREDCLSFGELEFCRRR